MRKVRESRRSVLIRAFTDRWAAGRAGSGGARPAVGVRGAPAIPSRAPSSTPLLPARPISHSRRQHHPTFDIARRAPSSTPNAPPPPATSQHLSESAIETVSQVWESWPTRSQCSPLPLRREGSRGHPNICPIRLGVLAHSIATCTASLALFSFPWPTLCQAIRILRGLNNILSLRKHRQWSVIGKQLMANFRPPLRVCLRASARTCP